MFLSWAMASHENAKHSSIIPTPIQTIPDNNIKELFLAAGRYFSIRAICSLLG
jgi:hypothetical protein